ncbi:MAG: hypothetical protein JWL84_1283 [Rhodospirillales bacterium]|nr:hypothetical protein [Rhodospirillales bacterium]
MSRIRELVAGRENLTWAWQKARRLYESADGSVNFGEVAAFELDLERNLRSIAHDFLDLSYCLHRLALIPQPKKPDKYGNPRLRQSFHVSVRDQVAWIALVNVIGPTLDSRMPAWSYGHRLYKAAWFEEKDEGLSHLEIGPYRHSSGNLYRRFKHSWPLFRRHLSLSARLMVHALEDEEQLDASEKSALNHSDKPFYLDRAHWRPVTTSILYYASIDLERFYPQISRHSITNGFQKYLADFNDDMWLRELIDRMLDFKVGNVGSRLLGNPIVQPETGAGPFDGIPTGLMVAGFLSNVAMLRLDLWTDQRLRRNHRIAHFRFVDDHAILAYDFDELRAWIRRYEKALRRLGVGPNISPDKFDPEEMAQAFKIDADEEIVSKAKTLSKLDGSHPSKLMTKTLALVSELAGTAFDILSEDSRDQRLRELEWLLLADLPDREIRSDTRAAFAAGRIATLVPVAFSPSIDLLDAWREFARLNSQKSENEGPAEKEKREIAEQSFKIWRDIDFSRYKKKNRSLFQVNFPSVLRPPGQVKIIHSRIGLLSHNRTQRNLPRPQMDFRAFRR